MKSWSRRFAAVGLMLLLAAAVAWAAVTLTGDGQDTSLVTRVIDGDTIDTGIGRIRFYGVDSPERDERCFDEATEFTRRLVGVAVRVENGPRMEDQFGRLLRYVYDLSGNSIEV